MSKGQEILDTEWSYWFKIDELEGGKQDLVLSPSEAEARRLCNRLGLMALDHLEAKLRVSKPDGAMRVHVKGKIEAQLRQPCVVTLEPVSSRIEEEFEAWFADPDAAVSLVKARRERESEHNHGEVPMLDESEDPEPIIDGRIDLGETVTQYLSLSINPYPHAEGVEFEVGDDQVKREGQMLDNPFAALKDWKTHIEKE